MLELAARGPQLVHDRREFLRAARVGGGGALALPNLLAARAAAAEAGRALPNTVPDTAVIQIWLGGGPSHIDMYDMKPTAPVEFRGAFQPISTCVPGLQICELMPLQAQRMDRLALIRSYHHATDDHSAGAHWTQTGYFGPLSIQPSTHPAAGAIAARVRGPVSPGLPAYVHIAPDPMTFPVFIERHGPAYLGPQAAPLLVKSARKKPDMGPYLLDNLIGRVEFDIPDLALPREIPLARLGERQQLTRELDRLAHKLDARQLDSMDVFQRQALEMVAGGAARRAFDLEREDPALRDRYGRNAWGQGALLCRRLVEAGVTFVTLNTDSFSGQWDSHASLPTRFREMLPVYDQMLVALIDDLVERGLYSRVLLLVQGEFGRTPRINPAAGRDHWGAAGFCLLGGAGLQGGAVIGATTAIGERPTERPICPEDVLATVYRVLGIDPNLTFVNHTGRPVPILPRGEAIRELF